MHVSVCSFATAEGLSDVRHRLKASEEERNRYEQQVHELEEKCRATSAAKSQLDLYRQKVEDLEENVNAEAKRALEVSGGIRCSVLVWLSMSMTWILASHW